MMRTFTVKSLYLLLPVIIDFVSCSENVADKTQLATERTPTFNAFLKKIPSIKLPIEIRGCSINTQGLTRVDNNNFISENVNYLYGKLDQNNKFIAVVFLASADCEIPVLATYDKSGNKIDEKEINIGYCGFDCGYNCNEIMSIDNNKNIFTADTISSYECDSLGNAIPGTGEHYVIYKQGRILETGKIELSKEIKKTTIKQFESCPPNILKSAFKASKSLIKWFESCPFIPTKLRAAKKSVKRFRLELSSVSTGEPCRKHRIDEDIDLTNLNRIGLFFVYTVRIYRSNSFSAFLSTSFSNGFLGSFSVFIVFRGAL